MVLEEEKYWKLLIQFYVETMCLNVDVFKLFVVLITCIKKLDEWFCLKQKFS